MNEAKLKEMLDVFCSYDFISIVEEVNTSLMEFMIIMIVISLSYGNNVKEKVETLIRLCESLKLKGNTQMSDLIGHLTNLESATVDTSKIINMRGAIKSNFLLKQIDDNKSNLIDKF